MALVPDQKFSTFQDGGDIVVGDIVVGLRNGLNTRFNFTGDLPPGVIVPITQGGTGATTAANARTNLGLGSMALQNASAVAITGGTIAGVSITASTAALTAGSVVAAPVAGTDIANKTYVDSQIGGTVTSVSGTLNRITSTGGATPIIDISASYVGQSSITTLGTIATGVWQGTLIGIPYGGTGVSSVTTSPTATAWVGWDANSNLSSSNFLEQADLITTAAGTTVLTVASRGQQIFSGTALQNITMPVVATLVNGQSYKLINNSTNALFVNSSGANAIVTMQPLTQAVLTFNGVAGTAAASWDLQYTSNTIGVQSITGTANQVIASSPTGNITLSLPQNIATTSSPTFAGLTLTNPYIAGAGGLHSFQIFTSGTALTYTRPANVSSILVELVGGGGGGGGSAGGGATFAAAGGGGSGGYARLWVPAAASSYTYTVGTAGLGGSAGANPGGTGGTTTFSASSLQATGGGGGAGSTGASAAASVFSSQGSGGVGSNGSLNCGGSPGGPGLAVLGSLSGGLGGSSFFGGGGDALTSATGAGMSALNYGSGGGGAASTTVSFAGGNGSAGLIVVWEFA